MLHTSSGDQLRMIKGGGSYLSQSEPRVYWGVPEGADVMSLTVTWPGGTEQTIDSLNLDETIVLLEPLE